MVIFKSFVACARTAKIRMLITAAAVATSWGVSAEVKLALEEPGDGTIVSGVANLRGWAVADSGIERVEVFINGAYHSDVPYGGDRGDVAGAFPNFPDAGLSGFGQTFNYGNLGPGQHTFSIKAFAKDGESAEASSNFEVVSFPDAFIPAVASPLLNSASSSISASGQRIELKGVRLNGGRVFDIELEWITATQGYEIQKIVDTSAPADEGNSGGDDNAGNDVPAASLPKLPEGMADDWLQYKQSLNSVTEHYSPLPTSINADEIWYGSIAYPSSAFDEVSASYQVSSELSPGVGYGTFHEQSAERFTVFVATWSSVGPNDGDAFRLDVVGGAPGELKHQKIKGGTRVFALNNGDDSFSFVIPGVDEGELFSDSGNPPAAPVMLLDEAADQWVTADLDTASHGAIDFDYGRDGDEDLLLQNWEGATYGPIPVILENTGDGFNVIPIEIPRDTLVGSMFVAPLDQGDGNLTLIVTDAVGSVGRERWGIEAEHNILITYPYAELGGEPLGVSQLPLPYFERSVFEGIESKVPQWEGNEGLSHDVAARAVDLDGDTDLDIVIASKIWSNTNPVSVLQILINHDGSFRDETDDRLFNWILASGAVHQLDFLDINGDGAVDILVSDTNDVLQHLEDSTDFSYGKNGIGGATRVLINDGTGHFFVVAHHQIHKGVGHTDTHVPSLTSDGLLRFTRIQPKHGSSDVEARVVTAAYPYSTGPNGRDSAEWGEPNFNEIYYLLHNKEAREAVEQGRYETGLGHFIAEGKAMGLKAVAR